MNKYQLLLVGLFLALLIVSAYAFIDQIPARTVNVAHFFIDQIPARTANALL